MSAMPRATIYATRGDVRGRCGHWHRTLRAAVQCLARDYRACRSEGRSSDRVIVARDPMYLLERPLNDVEANDAFMRRQDFQWTARWWAEIRWRLRGVGVREFRALCARCGRTGQAHWTGRGCWYFRRSR